MLVFTDNWPIGEQKLDTGLGLLPKIGYIRTFKDVRICV